MTAILALPVGVAARVSRSATVIAIRASWVLGRPSRRGGRVALPGDELGVGVSGGAQRDAGGDGARAAATSCAGDRNRSGHVRLHFVVGTGLNGGLYRRSVPEVCTEGPYGRGIGAGAGRRHVVLHRRFGPVGFPDRPGPTRQRRITAALRSTACATAR